MARSESAAPGPGQGKGRYGGTTYGAAINSGTACSAKYSWLMALLIALLGSGRELGGGLTVGVIAGAATTVKWLVSWTRVLA